MIVLGIESATELVGAAIGHDGGFDAAVTVAGRRRHAESLAPAIAQVLERADLGLHDVHVIAVDLGPGLFTGLRVGMATAKGLAQGLGIGLLGLNSLEILAVAAFDAGWPGTVVPVIDGRRGEVFTAHYARGSGPFAVVELSAPARSAPERVALDVDSVSNRRVLACGDGALRYRDLLVGTESLSVAGDSLASPDPRALVSLALARLASGAKPVTAAEVEPLYLRDADVRINWVERAPVASGGVPK
jgi:tRNA threonylcarbamoyladenosine biosynthesis protein TsaB